MSEGKIAAWNLAKAVARIIELDTMHERSRLLTPEEFAERNAARKVAEAVEGSEDSFVQGVLAPLDYWDTQ